MYKGDGSFRTTEIKQEEALIDLLREEKEFVDRYNSRAIGIEIARKNHLNVTDIYDELNKIDAKLKETRGKIAKYMTDNFNTKTSLGDILYDSGEHPNVVQLTKRKKQVGFDKDRNPVYIDIK